MNPTNLGIITRVSNEITEITNYERDFLYGESIN